jgi:tetratricopeptide (TPR) repeat protein
MGSALTSNEEAQLTQTIEMFEVITQSQPMDYQSLEILKEAYLKLGRHDEVIQTSKRIAEAYVQLGQLSSAILEYESILQNRPGDPDVQRALTEIENKANSFSAPVSAGRSDGERHSAAHAMRSVAGGREDGSPAEIDDGKQAMQKLFVETKCITPPDFEQFWPKTNLREALRQPKEPFIQVLSERGIQSTEKSLKLLCEKTRLPFLPIDKYDVDVEFARTFSKETCMRWCVLPFDRMSKSVLVATANPFNKQAEREIHSHSKSQLIWYMSQPAELMKVLKKIFR